MSGKTDAGSDLHVAWCSRSAAMFAVKNWHYSKSMPSGKVSRFGVWELGRFVGAILFGSGSIHHIGKPYGLQQAEICELVRVALRDHRSPVTRMIAITLRMLKDRYPGLRAVVSYADSRQGHHGGIYQGGNWIYVGESVAGFIVINGKRTHPRTVNARWGTSSVGWLRENVDPEAYREEPDPKYKYLMPLDSEMKHQLDQLAKPYPKNKQASEV